MKKKFIIGLVFVVLVIVGGLYFQKGNSTPNENKIKVGVILPLSGQYAVIGESIRNAMNMSLADLKDKNVELVFEDDGFDSKKGLSAYNKLQSVNDVDIIIGLSTPTLEVIKPIINKTNKVMLTVGNESSVENDNVFEIIPWATALFKTLGEEVSSKYSKIAVVYATDWQLALVNKEQFYKGLNNKNYIEIPISSNSDVRTEVSKMIAEGVDAYTVFLPVDQGVKVMNEVSKQAGAKRPQLICDANIELTIGDYLKKVADKSVFEGCISTMIADTTSKDYVAKYKEIYKSEPNFLGVYGYDAVQIISKVLASEKKSNWKKVLEDKKLVFNGVSGKILFDDTGSRVLESEAHIYKGGEFVKLVK